MCQHVHKGPHRRGKSPAAAQAWKYLADVEEQKRPRTGRGIIGKEVYSGGEADEHRDMERQIQALADQRTEGRPAPQLLQLHARPERAARSERKGGCLAGQRHHRRRFQRRKAVQRIRGSQ